MLENVYGRWKKSFLSIKKVRMELESSQKTIVVTPILSYDYGVKKRITRMMKVMIVVMSQNVMMTVDLLMVTT